MADPPSDIVLCSPKSPIREIFCALRVDIKVSNTSRTITRMCCIVFDNYAVNDVEFRESHGLDSDPKLGLSRLMKALKGESKTQRQPWQHPLTLLSAINKECAWSSARGQKEVNRAILGVELFSGTASWARNPPEESYLTSRTFSNAMRKIGIHRTNLTFIREMMDFQKHVWDGLYSGPSTSSVSIGLVDWSHPTHPMDTMSVDEKISFQDEVNFERNMLVHNRNQLVGVSQRFEFQTNLVSDALSKSCLGQIVNCSTSSWTRFFPIRKVSNPQLCLLWCCFLRLPVWFWYVTQLSIGLCNLLSISL